MAPTRSTETSDAQLLELARASVTHGVRHGTALVVDEDGLPTPLRERRPCFVTLRRGGALRGCVGSLEACSSLAAEAARNAFRAAFKDPRFGPVQEDELSALEFHVSVLSPLEPVPARSEEELLRALRPGVDGLVLEAGTQVATFLPAVWDQLAEPRSFVRGLKRKAGLSEDAWSNRWRCQRFTAREVG